MAIRIIFTVTNDLNTDQRMDRICSSLSAAGYEVLLVGRIMKQSVPLSIRSFTQKRMRLYFEKGKLFYFEYNLRLFFFLLFKKFDAVCAIDLDSILPCYFSSFLKNKDRVYDAHELFTEMKEIVTRPAIHKIWKKVERFTVPRFKNGYTVNQIIADEFKKMYGVNYEVIRSISKYESFEIPIKKEKYLIYQGAVNEGRCFETLIPAMKNVNAKLVICGTGNFMDQAVRLAVANDVSDKMIFKGQVLPEDLRIITRLAWAGITLFDKTGNSNYFSLANRFFDYIHAGIPQICVDYPAYREINNLHTVAVLISEPDEKSISSGLNKLIEDEDLYTKLQQACQAAALQLNWQEEEKKLLAFYAGLFA